MKKILTLLGIACAVLACTKTKTDVQSIELISQRDSVNYALGYLYGFMNNHMIKTDTTGEALQMFMSEYDRIAAGELKNCSKAYQSGYHLGLGMVNFETAGLSGNPHWPLNEDLLLKGLLAGLNQDTSIVTYKRVSKIRSNANMIRTNKWVMTYNPVLVKACPSDFQQVVMENKMDTINYAFGWSSGYGLAKSWAKDTTLHMDDFIKGINKAIRERPQHADAVDAAQKIALLTYNWQEKGLDGNNYPYLEDIFRQAVVNGLQKDTMVMNFEKSATYLNQTLPVCLPPVVKRRM